MNTLRPADLAREHGISTQAVRNYEQDGFIPPAERTPSGYRIYTETHAAALRAYLASPHTGTPAGQIMNEIDNGALDNALTIIDHGHNQLLRDRERLAAVKKATDHLTVESDGIADSSETKPRTVGELANRLRVTPATLRAWETAGILRPARDPTTGYRSYHSGDVRDAELAHLLRRGGYGLNHIATVTEQVRTFGGTNVLATALEDWQRKLTTRGVAVLDAASRLGHYLRLPDRAGSTASQ